MNITEKKKIRADEIKAIMDVFFEANSKLDITEYSYNLLGRLQRKRKIDITKGKKEIWAGAIVYLIARMNFLFDKSNPNYLTADYLAEGFNSKKRTLSSKASLIEKECDIGMVEPDLCSSELTEMLSFVQLPNGMVVSVQQARELGYNI